MKLSDPSVVQDFKSLPPGKAGDAFRAVLNLFALLRRKGGQAPDEVPFGAAAQAVSAQLGVVAKTATHLLMALKDGGWWSPGERPGSVLNPVTEYRILLQLRRANDAEGKTGVEALVRVHPADFASSGAYLEEEPAPVPQQALPQPTSEEERPLSPEGVAARLGSFVEGTTPEPEAERSSVRWPEKTKGD